MLATPVPVPLCFAAADLKGELGTPTMEIKSVSYVGLFDKAKNVLYGLNYDDVDTKALAGTLGAASDDISIFKDQMLLVYQNEEVFAVLLARPSANEVFVKDAFDSLVAALNKVLKRWSVDRVFEKYDQVVLIFNQFVFRGIILTDDAKELSSRVLKRSFESLQGIKMKKGLASFLNKASKSLI
ncbi:hypothetical protein PAPHI01_0017 [Pancytospora philotis]|nr:hypothetical protein PAPHI01_0017 [Pancytospora philotis]